MSVNGNESNDFSIQGKNTKNIKLVNIINDGSRYYNNIVPIYLEINNNEINDILNKYSDHNKKLG